MKNEIKCIDSDIKAIKNVCGSEVENVSFFGSFVKKRYDEVGDIDILIEAKQEKLQALKEKLEKLSTQLPIIQIDVQNYGKDKVRFQQQKGYHVLLLDSERKQEIWHVLNQFYGLVAA